ncbi:MAG: hypothetical protein H6581_19495 [Bacteroidia bacterium]|nr:hypothetical protein [Bacteroidia bacterium]
MVKRIQAYLPQILLGILLTSGFAFLAREVLIHPNTVYLRTAGDAFKNYYTPWYHVKYDSTYGHFEGMNYPYGDRLTYTDAQPLISNSLRFIDRNLFGLADQTVGILHYLIFLSYLACGFFLFGIFRKLRVSPWMAALFAAGITLLSPQLLRVPGHYALAYLAFVPGLWWFYLRWFDKRSLSAAAVVGAWSLAWSFVHPYYLLISFLWLGACWVISLCYPELRRDWKKLLPSLVIQVLLPIVLFKLLLSIGDHVTDRPAHPYGFFEYRANWSSLFLPMYLPHAEYLKRIFSLPEVHWEGVVYVSLAGTVAGLMFLFRSVRRIFRRQFRRLLRPGIHLWLNVSVLGAIAVMLFSQRYPFVKFLIEAVDHIPYMNQFRSIGRFAWVFYYIWTVYACYLSWLAFRRLRPGRLRRFALLVPLVTVGIFMVEGGLWNKFIRQKALQRQEIPELHDPSHALPLNAWQNELNPQDYSAIMVLPYFHLGSENFAIDNEGAVLPAFNASLSTGLPLLNVMMSRTSMSQTWSEIQLISEEYAPLDLVKYLKDPRPILVMSLKKVVHDRPYYLPSKGKLVYENEEMALYEVTREALAEVGKGVEEKVFERFAALDTLYRHPSGYLLSQPDRGFHYDPFEDMEPEMGYRGAGTERRGWDYNYLYRWNWPVPKATEITVSVWVYLKDDLRPLTELGLEQFNGDSVEYYNYTVTGHLVRRQDGDWALVETNMPLITEGNKVQVILRRDAKKPLKVRYDEFLIRQKDTDGFLFRDGNLVMNNRWVPLEGREPDSLLKGKVILDWMGN